MEDKIFNESKMRMNKAIEYCANEIAQIRTGRASTNILDNIKVDYYGTLTPLSQLANISVEDAKTLAIIPWEKSIVQDIEKTIMESDLGINPATSGDTIRVILPDLTEETRKEFIKKAKSDAENTKVSIRNVRREGNSQLKEFLKEKEISEDEERQGEEEIQKLTDIYVNKVDEILSFKEKDLLDF